LSGNLMVRIVHLRIHDLKHSTIPISIYRSHIDLVSEATLDNFLWRHTCLCSLSNGEAFGAGGRVWRCLDEDDLPVVRVSCIAIRNPKSGTSSAIVVSRTGEEAGCCQALRGCEVDCR
jgi:hypothetical protein